MDRPFAPMHVCPSNRQTVYPSAHQAVCTAVLLSGFYCGIARFTTSKVFFYLTEDMYSVDLLPIFFYDRLLSIVFFSDEETW